MMAIHCYISLFAPHATPTSHRNVPLLAKWEISIAKIFFALTSGFVPPLSNGTSRATSDRKAPKTNDQILPSPILFFPSKK